MPSRPDERTDERTERERRTAEEERIRRAVREEELPAQIGEDPGTLEPERE